LKAISNDTPLVGLNWAALYKWLGEIKEGNGKRQIVIDERRTKRARHSGRIRRRLHDLEILAVDGWAYR
jgi:hypothetical protein